MKNQTLFVLAIFINTAIFSQQSRFYSDPPQAEKFKEAKEYFQKEQYSWLSIIKELQQSVRETDKANHPLPCRRSPLYYSPCIKANESSAEDKAIEYIAIEKYSQGADDEFSGRVLFPQTGFPKCWISMNKRISPT
jgi:hypothetical protein